MQGSVWGDTLPETHGKEASQREGQQHAWLERNHTGQSRLARGLGRERAAEAKEAC